MREEGQLIEHKGNTSLAKGLLKARQAEPVEGALPMIGLGGKKLGGNESRETGVPK